MLYIEACKKYGADGCIEKEKVTIENDDFES